jgi:hypothetical protein
VLGGIRERNTEAPRARRGKPEAPGESVTLAGAIRWLTHTGREVSPSGLKSKQPDLCGRSTTKQPDLCGRSTTKQPDLCGRSTTKQPDLCGRSTTNQPDLCGRSTTKQPDLYGRSTTFASLRPCVFAFSSSKQPDLCGRSTTEQPGSLREIHYQNDVPRSLLFSQEPRKTDRGTLRRIARRVAV